MKKTIAILVFPFLFIFSSFGQTLQDTKDFITEKLDANDPIQNYDNFVFFQNILPKDAAYLAGKTLSEDELKYLFIYGYECHLGKDKKGGIWLTKAQTIDIRDISKVSTTRRTGEFNTYTITVYILNKYYSKKYSKTAMGKDEYEYLDKMEIIIGDNSEVANKIKKAIIHLGSFVGTVVKDGDIF